MTGLAIALAVYLAAVGLAFVVSYATRSRWRVNPAGWNAMAVSVGMVALITALLVQRLIWPVPAWVYVLILAELDVAFTQRLWLQWRLSRKEGDRVDS